MEDNVDYGGPTFFFLQTKKSLLAQFLKTDGQFSLFLAILIQKGQIIIAYLQI
jgi:hypothetical protein